MWNEITYPFPNNNGTTNCWCYVHMLYILIRLCFYETRSAWSMDQGSTRKHSAAHNFAPTVTKFCVMWEGLSLPHDTKFGKCRGEIVDRRMIFIWTLIHGSGWSGLIKSEPGKLNWWYVSTLSLSFHLCPLIPLTILGPLLLAWFNFNYSMDK